jgi:hypothetical protein
VKILGNTCYSKYGNCNEKACPNRHPKLCKFCKEVTATEEKALLMLTESQRIIIIIRKKYHAKIAMKQL